MQVGLDGLVVGQQYEVSFEQSISNGNWPTTGGYWEVIFGAESHNSAAMALPAVGVVAPWMWQTLLFTATSTIQTLEVVAHSANGPRTDIGIDSFFLGDPGTNPDNPDVGYLLHSGNPNLLRSGLAADTRGHRRAVVFGDQATALHPKTA